MAYNRLERAFFEAGPVEVARELLGKLIVRIDSGIVMAAKIVECEAYMGEGDKAAHFNDNKVTERTRIVYGQGGLAYIYLIYGMYNCFNIVTGKSGAAGAVLIRAAEPVEGIQSMHRNRFVSDEIVHRNIRNLTNGPGKLCMAMNIDRSFYGEDLVESKELFIAEGEKIEKENIIEAKRVNIDYAQEAADFLYRFYIKGNRFVSKK
ncbi:putative 3-methyladenine DNA glycosylase [Peptoclostridium acidaminophilum DSM 3953]|uniref:Putative 3-methyladenine DNA glycosylase n=1 Tax=Peptoclostridium acidaminophilum DSM 3953 TaxID=1286171 RepID=W8T7N3_PEPAC|nr:DNA-3-methyladenine glycosylase [Peptoclostridium acidaminophilum]AHM56910.1 putative 3-methyladenine DNA glycosylase [Peptoclostridium acidaminophilum DSM 3953]